MAAKTDSKNDKKPDFFKKKDDKAGAKKPAAKGKK